MVLVERDGQARSNPIERVDAVTMKGEIRRTVHKDSTIMTDEWSSYRGIGMEFKGGHMEVLHAQKQYSYVDKASGINVNTRETKVRNKGGETKVSETNIGETKVSGTNIGETKVSGTNIGHAHTTQAAIIASTVPDTFDSPRFLTPLIPPKKRKPGQFPDRASAEPGVLETRRGTYSSIAVLLESGPAQRIRWSWST